MNCLKSEISGRPLDWHDVLQSQDRTNDRRAQIWIAIEKRKMSLYRFMSQILRVELIDCRSMA